MAQLMEFHPYLQQAYLRGVLTPLQAWEMEVVLQLDLEPTQEQVRLSRIVNLVNLPPEMLQAQ
jgi:hypothetical protein